MTLNWTKSDEKRAAKMGWTIVEIETKSARHNPCYKIIQLHTFRTDREAAEWVLKVCAGFPYGLDEKQKHTCRRAVLLCMTGGAR